MARTGQRVYYRMFATTSADDKHFCVIQSGHPEAEFIKGFLVDFDVAVLPR